MDKQYLKMAAMVLICLLGLIFFLRSCDGDRDYNILKGRFSAFKEEAEKEKQASEKEISEQEEKIKSLAEENRKLEEKNVSIKAENRKKDADLKKLEEELASIPVDDKIAVINNLKSQIKVWKDKFTLAQQEMGNKDQIIFNLTREYKLQVVISDQWKGQYQRENQLRLIAEKMITECDKKLKYKGLESRIEKIIIVGLGGYVAYKLIKEM